MRTFSYAACCAFLLLGLSGCATQTLQQGGQEFYHKDYAQSFQKLAPLAEKGNADAQYAIGYMYYYGEGVRQSQPLALKWIRKAAAQGQPQAVVALPMFKQ